MPIKLAPFNAVEAEFAQKIFDLMIANPGMTEGQLARQLKTFPRAVKPMLERMLERGSITRRLSGFVRLYYAADTTARAKETIIESRAMKPLSAEYLRLMQFAMNKR